MTSRNSSSVGGFFLTTRGSSSELTSSSESDSEEVYATYISLKIIVSLKEIWYQPCVTLDSQVYFRHSHTILRGTFIINVTGYNVFAVSKQKYEINIIH